ncbi:AAA-like domain-containing protein [Candidatus Parabeggiatoa sp. HSG14]|uniref:AAA-like domain-containing protein n=1 Tax=Candidatus Parabeggiatoa sp. HSG14 TaxID=3055593 RepID=UPI0025A70DD6|nr:AAA-like domain-containing protein [Thiotrichales bacterium HSG14]
MSTRLHTFETRGPVDPKYHYVVPRTEEIADLGKRIKDGRYIVIFAPRQTGKTTFFRWALDSLDETYLSIQLNFEDYKELASEEFYHYLKQDILQEIKNTDQLHDVTCYQFLENYSITSSTSMREFFEQLGDYLKNRRLVIIVDEFDGIPTKEVNPFLHSLRRIYLSKKTNRCPYSLGIVGVKSITQLNYDRSISPFNIQDEFALPNFTLSQVQTLLAQYTLAVGQAVAPEVIENLHKQTFGQPFLVNRMAQILTTEMGIARDETILATHFEIAHQRISNEQNVHLSHLTTNIRRDPRFKTILMEICSYEAGIPFNLHNEYISELVTYGILKTGEDGFCEVTNPIYQYCIVQTFRPLINGLERQYLPEDTDDGFGDYLTAEGKINMHSLLVNFRDFMARAGFRILQVPDTPQEFVGQYLLFAYLDQFVRQMHGFMYPEVRTGRGRMDLILLHQGDKYIVETKIWEGTKSYQAGKRQLAKYLKLEGVAEGYYIVFDHRKKPQALFDTDTIEEKSIVSYCIPVIQEQPSTVAKENPSGRDKSPP